MLQLRGLLRRAFFFSKLPAGPLVDTMGKKAQAQAKLENEALQNLAADRRCGDGCFH